MARLPYVTREMIAPDLQDAFDKIIERRGGGPITGGPTSMMIYSPQMNTLGTALNDYLVTDSVLSKKIIELGILLTARCWDNAQIWNSHAGAGRREGLSDALVDALRDKKTLPALAPDEAAAVNYANEYFRTRRVGQDNFQAAVDQFGPRGLVELTALIGYYGMLAFISNAFEVGVPANATEPLLPV